MASSVIRFGTDGWRAVIGEEYTFENLRRVVQATAEVWRSRNYARRGFDFAHHGVPSAVEGRRAAVGFDTRFLSRDFARAAAEVLAGNGFQVFLSDGPVPTTGVSLAVRRKNLAGALIITASHNPPEFNGLKVKASFAGPADPDLTGAIEERIGKSPVRSVPFEEALRRGRIVREDLRASYEKFLASAVNLRAVRAGRFRVLIDCMHGVSGPIFRRLLSGGKLNVTLMNENADVLFGGIAPEPIPRNACELMARMKRGEADLGIGIDGDADRIGAVLPGGRFLYPAEILSLLAMHLVEERRADGAIAKTISGSVLINRVGAALGRRVYETPIGYKHICDLQLRTKVLIGGEESGGIGVTRVIPERDGILSALLLLEMMAGRKEGIASIFRKMEGRFGKLAYARRDFPCAPARKKGFYERLLKRPLQAVDGSPVAEIRSYDGVKFIAADESWLLVRFSGTEPVLRVYAESTSPARVQRILNEAEKYIHNLSS